MSQDVFLKAKTAEWARLKAKYAERGGLDICEPAPSTRLSPIPEAATVEQRLERIEDILELVALSGALGPVIRDLQAGVDWILLVERYNALKAGSAENLAKGILAMDEADLLQFCAGLDVTHYAKLSGNKKTREARDRALGCLNAGAQAKIAFDLCKLAEIEFVRVTRLGPTPEVILVPAKEAPKATDTLLVESVPEAVSRREALTRFQRAPEAGRALPTF